MDFAPDSVQYLAYICLAFAPPYLFLTHAHVLPYFIRVWLKKHVLLPLVPGGITRLQASQLVLFTTVNVIVLIYPIRGLQRLAHVASSVSVANMVPLFLGGYTSPFADRLYIPLPTYRFWHVAIACIAAMQGTTHGAIWLHHVGFVNNRKVISGILAMGLLMALILTPILWLLKWYNSFAYSHIGLAVCTAGAVLWHVLEQRDLLLRLEDLDGRNYPTWKKPMLEREYKSRFDVAAQSHEDMIRELRKADEHIRGQRDEDEDGGQNDGNNGEDSGGGRDDRPGDQAQNPDVAAAKQAQQAQPGLITPEATPGPMADEAGRFRSQGQRTGSPSVKEEELDEQDNQTSGPVKALSAADITNLTTRTDKVHPSNVTSSSANTAS
ncbi:hypothetical protein Micbo1qcDRAFT_210168 [Microdochium bolleyi]|uniref:Uncharacterized protein n=1 Tax=Microdochium bolleyi TaxID=196109 RepID=A0A136IK89_9PEZI|nr:hypothetical protein Micbo1qcDRAFT_210168 [Microdochium bolleyi]